jgi:hypothetical protein
MRKALAVASIAALPLAFVACSDDDDNNQDEIDTPDLDPGNGSGLPDVDPGEGTGLPGGNDDTGTTGGG